MGFLDPIMDGKCGLLNLNTGEYILEPKYDNIHAPIDKGIISVKMDGKWGLLYIKTDEYLVEPKYDYTYPPNDKGIARLQMGYNWGLLNTETKQLSFDDGETWIDENENIYILKTNSDENV